MSGARFGVIGLGTMGRNLAFNIESRGVPVAVWNLETEWVDEFLRDHPGEAFTGTKSLEELVAALERPRRILMMIPAGKPVDQTIEKHQAGARAGRHPHRRRQLLVRGHAPARGRAAAARASITSAAACRAARKARATARRSCRAARESVGRAQGRARGDRGAGPRPGPCVTHVGPDGAGHFVKMVHNGIEYGDMQLIAEAWDVLRRGLGMSAAETADVFDDVEPRPLESFLVELTAKVCRVDDPETGSRWSMWSSTRPARRAPASGRRRSRWISASRCRRSPRRSTRACCRA